MTDQVVIFDGDDTLWSVEALYDDARTMAASIVAKEGYDATEFEKLQRSIDVVNVAKLGLSPDRFPTSSVEAYQQLALRAGRQPIVESERAVWSASASVFDVEAPLMPHAHDVLAMLQGSFRLHLLTNADSR